jgi:hypothetical protein
MHTIPQLHNYNKTCSTEALSRVLDQLVVSGHEGVVRIAYSPQIVARLTAQGRSWSLTQWCTTATSEKFSISASGECLFCAKLPLEDTTLNPGFPAATHLHQLGASAEDICSSAQFMHVAGHMPSQVHSAIRRYGLYGSRDAPDFCWAADEQLPLVDTRNFACSSPTHGSCCNHWGLI